MGFAALPLLAIGAVSSIMGGMQQAAQQKALANQEKQAMMARREDRENRRDAFIGTQLAEQGASGALVNIGSTGDVVVNTAKEFGREQGDDTWNTRQKIYTYKQNAQNAITNSLFDAVGGVMGKGLSTSAGG